MCDREWRGNENTIVFQLRYHEKNTIIHKLNPFCKLGWAFSIVLFALLFDNPVYTVLLFLLIIPVITTAGVRREWGSFMKIALPLCIVIILINVLLNNHGANVLLKATFSIPVIGTPTVTLEAICFSAVMSLRLLTILSVFTIVTFTIHPDDLMLSMIKAKLPISSALAMSRGPEDWNWIRVTSYRKSPNALQLSFHFSPILLTALSRSPKRWKHVVSEIHAREHTTGKYGLARPIYSS
jgi:hypothetical protein